MDYAYKDEKRDLERRAEAVQRKKDGEEKKAKKRKVHGGGVMERSGEKKGREDEGEREESGEQEVAGRTGCGCGEQGANEGERWCRNRRLERVGP